MKHREGRMTKHAKLKADLLRAVDTVIQKAYAKDATVQAKKPAALKQLDKHFDKVLRPFFTCLVLALLARPAHAQLATGWDVPMTPASDAVRQALARGLCDEAGVAYVQSLGVPAVVTNAGAPWPADRHIVMWYRKGPSCSGAFQYVPESKGGGDRGLTGGYREGWEASWTNWAPGPGDATHPTDPQNGDHPTAWRFQPGSAFDPSYVSVAPTPVPVPPPPIPIPPIVQPPAPPPVVTIDVAAIIAKLNEIEQQNVQLEAKLEAAVNNPSWFKQVFGNQYVQLALTGIGTYFATKATK